MVVVLCRGLIVFRVLIDFVFHFLSLLQLQLIPTFNEGLEGE